MISNYIIVASLRLIGVHELHGEMHVGSCRHTHSNYVLINSTFSTLQENGPFKVWLPNNLTNEYTVEITTTAHV